MADSGTSGPDSHPLKTEWKFWELRSKDRELDTRWWDQYCELCTVSTVEEFWVNYDALIPISKLFKHPGGHGEIERAEPSGRMRRSAVEAYSIFRAEVKPEIHAKDPSSDTRYTLARLRCRKSGRMDDYDSWWRTLVLCVIGESLDGAEFVNGVTVTDKHKKGKKSEIALEIWLNTADPTIHEVLVKSLNLIVHEQTGTRLRFDLVRK